MPSIKQTNKEIKGVVVVQGMKPILCVSPRDMTGRLLKYAYSHTLLFTSIFSVVFFHTICICKYVSTNTWAVWLSSGFIKAQPKTR